MLAVERLLAVAEVPILLLVFIIPPLIVLIMLLVKVSVVTFRVRPLVPLPTMTGPPP